MPNRPAHRRLGSVVLTSAAALVLVSPGGCYQRVVRAEGLGARGVDVHEPNLPDDSSRNDLERKQLKVSPLKTGPKRR